MIIKTIQKRINELEKIRGDVLAKKTSYPEGRLRIAQTKQPQYFIIRNSGDSIGTYIKKSDRNIAALLAEKDYYEKLSAAVNEEMKSLQDFLKRYNAGKVDAVYDKLCAERKKLISPIYLSDTEYSINWQNQPIDGNPFHPDELKYKTNRGDYVRSKSEKMIADMYYENGIPYKYECPVCLNNGITKYPDFTLLHPHTRREIYHEHLGLLEDEDYRKNNLIKIREYEKAGIRLGSNLIITYETSYCPLDVNLLRETITDIFSKN